MLFSQCTVRHTESVFSQCTVRHTESVSNGHIMNENKFTKYYIRNITSDHKKPYIKTI